MAFCFHQYISVCYDSTSNNFQKIWRFPFLLCSYPETWLQVPLEHNVIHIIYNSFGLQLSELPSGVLSKGNLTFFQLTGSELVQNQRWVRNQGTNKLVDFGLCSPALDLLCFHRSRNTLIGCASVLRLGTGWSFSHCYRFQWSRDPAFYSGLPTYYSNYIHVASNY